MNSINNIDKFGIKKLYRTEIDGREWSSKWGNGHIRSWTDQTNDPDDTEFVTQYKGDGSYSTLGDGILSISPHAGVGTPRMYIMDVEQIKNWHNVEITVYAQRITDNNVSYAGITAVARTNHYLDTNTCDARGYAGRFTFDGRIDFNKEISHHAPSKGDAQVATVKYWPTGMPKNVWIGYKYIVYDLPNGDVKLELYMDNTNGLNGGEWIKITEFIDTGINFGVGYTPCKLGIDPALSLTSSDIRLGSETGRPNLTVYFRSDGIGTNGLLYKKASVREIIIDTITVTNPTNITYKRCEKVYIKWEFTGNIGSYVKIILLRGNNIIETIKSTTPNDGILTWKIQCLPPGVDYQIKIMSKTNDQIFGISDKFTIR